MGEEYETLALSKAYANWSTHSMVEWILGVFLGKGKKSQVSTSVRRETIAATKAHFA